ncbi:alanine dehydrogenase [Cytophagales bacterium LB-30]|uniref:alanine dehydrogenase n=1 Tax=Shiella aurantiaca TaxID=3058365 RepID=A0ABT8F5B4_9BACT|nr:alanine dehydrogenase [Shiella aurantiaca]MDN4165444.1 alanine dehydrogenase [Shiella aurantiaca]
MNKPTSGFEKLAKESSLYPQESLLKVKEGKNALFIGVPKETSLQENRVPLTPEAVAILVLNGHEVWIEAGAGAGSKFSDKEFSDVGAKIVYNTKEVYEANIILKIEPPTLEEIEMIKPGRTIISAIQLGSQSPKYIQAINERKLTAIAYELIEDKVGGMPFVRSMSEIAGSTVMLIAAEYLSSVNHGRGIILGGITGVPPTKVVILGAGTVAEYAARTALGLGAEIQIFDSHIYKLRRIKHTLGQQVYTATIDTTLLSESLKNADVVIGAIRAERGRNKCVVTEEMVAAMKPDSIIIDVSIDQGGCVETSEITTHDRPIFKKHGVIHYCVPNIASRVARTATYAFSNIISHMLLQAAEMGGMEDMIFNSRWFMRGVYCYKGYLTNAHVARKFNLKHKDLNLFMAARF